MFSLPICIYFVNIILSLDAARTMGPLGNIILNSVMGCKDKPTGDAIQVSNLEAKSIDDKGNKALFFDIVIKTPIDATIQHNIDVLRWQGGGWKKVYNIKGKFCTDVHTLCGKLYENFRVAVKPPFPENCPIKPGSYSLRNFQSNTKDLGIPAIFYGRLKLVLTLLKDSKVIFCVQGEGDSQDPAYSPTM